MDEVQKEALREESSSTPEAVKQDKGQGKSSSNALLVADELWQTNLRRTITPYLPPPVVQAMNRVDLELEAHVGPEGSITILSSLFLGWFILLVVRWFLSRFSGSGRALADDEEDAILASTALAAASSSRNEKYDATVLLVGPSGGGKTRLFYRLCFGSPYSKMPTLMSLKANVGISSPSSIQHQHDGDNSNKISGRAPDTIRYMDWPGHASLSDKALKSVLVPSTRFVLVLDATQPVAPAADVLYQILSLVVGASQKQKTITSIFVACHKTDYPKAKNWRRIKIQMRTELERLLTVRAAAASDNDATTNATTKTPWWPACKSLDLEQIPGVRLYFSSTSSEGLLSPELCTFCQTGELPEDK